MCLRLVMRGCLCLALARSSDWLVGDPGGQTGECLRLGPLRRWHLAGHRPAWPTARDRQWNIARCESELQRRTWADISKSRHARLHCSCNRRRKERLLVAEVGGRVRRCGERCGLDSVFCASACVGACGGSSASSSCRSRWGSGHACEEGELDIGVRRGESERCLAERVLGERRRCWRVAASLG